jgi:hypothetical protein
MTCDQCPAPAIAVLPGSEPVTEAGIVLSRGVRRQSWCRCHWPWLQPAAQAATSMEARNV